MKTEKMIKALLIEALAPNDGIEEQELYEELDKTAHGGGKSRGL